MRIRGIGGDESSQLAPEEWVNVWQVSDLGLEFYDTCQVKHLGDLTTEDYFLEPVEVEP
ncbi:hypothetical protein GFS31_08560 [Leptolyngbya sp. BL0902]|uniref:hypothetical protein n=1 Tax=Leptolyngbya sp. BL0902 TaxID=1115757 RepID=UPI0018E90544|nr:hypothetical protein [Leptolyngbya sp. BL0902]QQE64177.1 hypothetical protein GFS31_08560 [Leptolyngbya sp. BL0902]